MLSADFWAGYVSGAAGIIIGNPLDILKVRLQAGSNTTTTTTSTTAAAVAPSSPPTHPAGPARARARIPILLGTAAPVLTYGALNALLFVSYNRSEAFLAEHLDPVLLGTTARNGSNRSNSSSSSSSRTSLTTTWLAGAIGGLATWAVSTPTEVIKCRAQVSPGAAAAAAATTTSTSSSSPSSSSSWTITKQVLRHQGVRGLFAGGGVTAVRDSVGYGFYFWGYELATRWWWRWCDGAGAGAADAGGEGGKNHDNTNNKSILHSEAARVLVCGGLAGILTWASVFPLDVIKTRVQTQGLVEGTGAGTGTGTGTGTGRRKRLGAWDVAKETYREGGIRPFFRGLTVCSIRAFIVNAVQWAVYEWIMMELGQGRVRQEGAVELGAGSG